jgi:mono/diheme cytochrome c family protein
MMPRKKQRKPVATILTCVLLCANTILAADDKPYSVVDGKLDENTFKGWQTYRGVCGVCHGGAAEGGAAPSLVDRLKTIDKEQFKQSVLNGKNLMPPWKTNPNVVENLDNLYAYIKGRSDGAIAPGKQTKQ